MKPRTRLNLTRLEDRWNPTGPVPGFNDTLLTGIALTGDARVSTPNGAPIAVSHDGTERIALGALPGSPPTLRVFDSGGSLIFQKNDAYFTGFTGGVRVAFGDVNNDGIDDLATSAGDGGGPHVVIYDGRTYAQIRSMWGIDDPNFHGGSVVSLGKWGNTPIMVTIAGKGGGPRQTIKDMDGNVLDNRYVYTPTLRNGGEAFCVDVNRDGYDEVINTAGLLGGPHIRVFDGYQLSKGIESTLDWFADDPSLRVGVYGAAGVLSLKDGTPCGAAVFITTAAPGNPNPNTMRVWNPATGQLIQTVQIPGDSSKAGAFAAVAPAKNAGDQPEFLLSTWQPTGDRVYGYGMGYNYSYWCPSVIVSPPPVVPPPPPSADLHIVKTASAGSVQVGNTVSFTIQVSDDGPSAATGVIVSDPLPSGFAYQSIQTSVGTYNAVTGQWMIGTLQNGQAATLTITGIITTTITNTATVTSAVGDPDPTDNTSSVTVTGTPVPPPPAPTLVPLSVNELDYLITSSGAYQALSDANIGIGPKTLVRVVVTLQSGTWDDVSYAALQLFGSLSSDPRLGATYTIDSTRRVLVIDNINYALPAGATKFRLSVDAINAPLQVLAVDAWGY